METSDMKTSAAMYEFFASLARASPSRRSNTTQIFRRSNGNI